MRPRPLASTAMSPLTVTDTIFDSSPKPVASDLPDRRPQVWRTGALPHITRWENSEVLPEGSVAVAVMTWRELGLVHSAFFGSK